MRKGTTILAIFLILLGTFLLLNQFGFLDWNVMWPVLPFAGGLAFLGSYIFGQRHDPDKVFIGTAATLVGLVFFFVTVGPLEYSDLNTWWPIFVLTGGVAFLAQWVAGRFRDGGALFLAIVGFVVGGAGLAVTLELLGPETRELLPRLWPVLVILGGLMILLRPLFRKRSK